MWSHIGDVSHCCRDTGRGNSGNNAADEEPANRRRNRHHGIIETKTEAGEQEDRPASESIGEHPDHRREKKLHRREHG